MACLHVNLSLRSWQCASWQVQRQQQQQQQNCWSNRAVPVTTAAAKLPGVWLLSHLGALLMLQQHLLRYEVTLWLTAIYGVGSAACSTLIRPATCVQIVGCSAALLGSVAGHAWLPLNVGDQGHGTAAPVVFASGSTDHKQGPFATCHVCVAFMP